MHRVEVSLVISGYESVVPPTKPPRFDEDETAVLSDCYDIMCLWPKSQIRLLAAGGTTPQTTTAVGVPAPCDPIGAQEYPNEDDDLDDDIHADQFINTSFDDGAFMPHVEEAYHSGGARDPAGPAAKPTCAARLFPSSQEMSPAACAFTEPQDATNRFIISPNTLHKVAVSR